MKMKKLIAGLVLGFFVLAGCNSGGGSATSDSTTSSDSSTNDVTEEVAEVTIYFARHGKTMLNTVDRSQGWIDAPLTPAGVEVAEFLGKGLTDVTFDKVYSSNSGRAIETAELILENSGQADLEIIKDKRFREFNFGTYEGMMNEEMLGAVAKEEGLSAEEYQKKMAEEGFYKSIIEFADILSELDKKNVEEGVNWPAESSQEIIDRTSSALKDVVTDAQESGAKTILIVSHGMTISTILGQIDENAEIPASGLKNASISKITYSVAEESYSIDAVNDMTYVEAGENK